MDTMSKAMASHRQSTAFKKQIDKAVATTVGSQFEATKAALQALERQVEMLSEKLDELLKE